MTGVNITGNRIEVFLGFHGLGNSVHQVLREHQTVPKLFKWNRTSRLRIMRVYLLFILACTFLLFCFNVISFYRDRETLHLLSHQDPEVQLIQSSQHSHQATGFAYGDEMWFIGLSSFTFISILAVVVYLLVHVSSDIRWLGMRSDFVSGVSHDFKTPLSLIRLYSETLADHDQEFSLEERQNYVRIIARESTRLGGLVDNVLSFSSLEKGKQSSLELQEGDITRAVEQVTEEYSEYLVWQGFQLQSSIERDLPRVRFSRERLSQMLLNLIENAIKYSGPSKRVIVRAWAKGTDVIIEVQDHGPGISPEEQEKIFLPFYRASKGTEKGGCGLGLHLVDQIMKEHGGRVEVDSELNKGSRFRLVFPTSAPDSGSRSYSRRWLLSQRGFFDRAENTNR